MNAGPHSIRARGSLAGVFRSGLAGVLALAVLLTGCSKRRTASQPPVPVTVAKAEKRSVPFEISATGTVEPIRAVAVTSQVSGVVESVGFREGEDVGTGQVLVRIDARPYENALSQADAQLARDQAQLVNARRQVERYQALAQNEYVTTEQFEGFRTNAEALAAAIKADSAAVSNARLNLEYTTIRAPIAGRTGSLLIKEGNLVRAPGSGPLVMINQVRPIQVRFAVPANRLPEIRRYVGNTLKVRASPTNDDHAALAGVLTFVDNTVDTTTGTILLKARFENPQGTLWPGQFVTATLELYTEQNAVTVPAQSVMNGQNGSYVFVVQGDGKAATRPVEIGRNVGDAVILTKGVDPGETVVTDGQLRLVAGAMVQVKNGGDGRPQADSNGLADPPPDKNQPASGAGGKRAPVKPETAS